MDRLSTEIDENIAQRLGRKELSALSKTSKYYRSLAEPYLYHELTFSVQQYISLVSLFETILDRRDLARHIRSFTLTDAGVPDATPTFTETFFDRIWAKFNTLKDFIDELVPLPSRALAVRWLRRVLADAPRIDGQLAVILCLAQNIEHLELVRTGLDSLPITRAIVGMCWVEDNGTGLGSKEDKEIAGEHSKDPVEHNNEDRSYPFYKLKSLCISNQVDDDLVAVPVLPSMEVVQLGEHLGDKVKQTLYFPYLDSGMGSQLRTIEIVRVNLCLSGFEKTIAAADLCGLKELVVREVGWNCENEPWEEYDFARMSHVISEHLRGLESLEWSRQNYDRNWYGLQRFGSFKGLRSLTSLIVDFELISPVDDNFAESIHLLNAQDMLPVSLESLSITNMDSGFFAEINETYTAGPLQHTATEYILNIAATLHLKVFELSLEMERWDVGANGTVELDKSSRSFLPIMVEALNNLGIRMRVWRQKGKFEEKLLYEPGFAAAGPHWADVDEKYRADHYHWDN